MTGGYSDDENSEENLVIKSDEKSPMKKVRSFHNSCVVFDQRQNLEEFLSNVGR